MKNFLKFLCVFAFSIFMCNTSFAQIKLGGGIAYGTEIEELGITAKGHYAFTEVWEGAASFTFFFTGEDVPGADLRIWEFNADAHYILTTTDKFAFYPLAGLNITGVTIDIDSPIPGFGGKTSNSEVGLNAGAGIELFINENISAVGELKYVLSDFDQLVINVGILFGL